MVSNRVDCAPSCCVRSIQIRGKCFTAYSEVHNRLLYPVPISIKRDILSGGSAIPIPPAGDERYVLPTLGMICTLK